MKTASASFAAFLFITAAAASRAAEPLRFHARNGEEFHCTVTSDMDMKGVGFSMKVKAITVYDFRCASDSAPFEIEASIVREKFSLDMDIPFVGKVKGAIDTAGEKPAAPKNPMDFGRMVPYGLHVLHAAKAGRPFTLVVDETGAVIRMRGVQALLDKAKETIDEDGLINPMMAQNLKQDLTVQAFSDAVEGIFVALPSQPPTQGLQWSREYERTARDKSVLKLKETMTLGEIAGSTVSFAGVTTLVKDGQEIKPEPPPMTAIHSARADSFRLDVEGVLDAATGRPVFSVSLLEYAATLSVQGPMDQEPREVRQVIKAETTIEHGPGKAAK